MILISTYPGVATVLASEGYYVAQVYPAGDEETKQEWLRRLESREKLGKASRLYGLVEAHWESWFEEMGRRTVAKSKIVGKGEYLSEMVAQLYEDYERAQGMWLDK